jgi:hypothetical protein
MGASSLSPPSSLLVLKFGLFRKEATQKAASFFALDLRSNNAAIERIYDLNNLALP